MCKITKNLIISHHYLGKNKKTDCSIYEKSVPNVTNNSFFNHTQHVFLQKTQKCYIFVAEKGFRLT